jgi:hypothetical protein
MTRIAKEVIRRCSLPRFWTPNAAAPDRGSPIPVSDERKTRTHAVASPGITCYEIQRDIETAGAIG